MDHEKGISDWSSTKGKSLLKSISARKKNQLEEKEAVENYHHK